MAKFDIAFDYVIENEGREVSKDETDRGGITKFGISEKFIKELANSDFQEILPDDEQNSFVSAQVIRDVRNIESYIKGLTIEQAKWIYQKYFWLPIYEKIENQDICNYIFDMAVQHGHHKAAELVQRAINAILACKYLDVDGILGLKTLEEVNCYYDNIDHRYMQKYLIQCLRAVRESLFRCIVAHDKTQEDKLGGWLKRCYR